LAEKHDELLVAREKYLAAGIHVSGKYRTKFMKEFIFRIRNDGLSILDIRKVDERLRVASRFLSQFPPKDILVVGRRDTCRNALIKFSEVTGIKVIAGRYMPGTLTNPSHKELYMEPKLIVVCDPWVDRVALEDAMKVNIPIIALCDTNTIPSNIDLVVPCNNKSRKSLALIFWLLAREYLKLRGIIKKDEEFKYEIKDFM